MQHLCRYMYVETLSLTTLMKHVRIWYILSGELMQPILMVQALNVTWKQLLVVSDIAFTPLTRSGDELHTAS